MFIAAIKELTCLMPVPLSTQYSCGDKEDASFLVAMKSQNEVFALGFDLTLVARYFRIGEQANLPYTHVLYLVFHS